MTITVATQRTQTHPACPAWCVTHESTWHIGEWRLWQSGYSLQIRLQMVRHDDIDTHTGEHLIGQIDFNVRTEPNVGSWDVDGVLECNEMRALGAFLTALADEADPHHLDGEPVEWHTPGRRRRE